MKLSEINFRDPFILATEGMYYMYGTTVFHGNAQNFVCYKSPDLENWEGPIEIFRRSEDFWADRCYWAPECYAHNGQYYFLTTMGSDSRKKGIQVMTCTRPDGIFTPLGDGPVTPEGWTCIDGTLYWEDGKPWLVFSRSFEDGEESTICAMPMSDDLSQPDGEIVTLFAAKDAPWACPCPWAEAEFGLEGEIYLSDGPCLYRTSGDDLLMIWSSWGQGGYTVGVARSVSGRLAGPWEQQEVPLFREGGHGMIFTDREGRKFYVLHSPNEPSTERPRLYELLENGHTLVLKGV